MYRPFVPQKSYIIIDNKKSLFEKYGAQLAMDGYNLKVFDITNPKLSMHYNSFYYLQFDFDMIVFADYLLDSIQCEDDKDKNKEEIRCERTLLSALIAYICREAPKDEQNIESLLEILSSYQTDEYDVDGQKFIDLLFKELEKKKPDSFAINEYKGFKSLSGENMDSIMLSCCKRFSAFFTFKDTFNCDNFNTEYVDLLKGDEMELDNFFQKPIVLFIIIPPDEAQFTFLVNLLLEQLCYIAHNLRGRKRIPLTILTKTKVWEQIPVLVKLLRINSLNSFQMTTKKGSLKKNMAIEFGKPLDWFYDNLGKYGHYFGYYSYSNSDFFDDDEF